MSDQKKKREEEKEKREKRKNKTQKRGNGTDYAGKTHKGQIKRGRKDWKTKDKTEENK